jgi:tetratricopeptide (TPR) repeat protein
MILATGLHWATASDVTDGCLLDMPVVGEDLPALVHADQKPTNAPAPQPATVLDLAEQARAKAAARQWKEAAALWTRVVRINPVQPYYWNALGDAHYRAADYKAAVVAYEKAIELGAPLMGVVNPAAYDVVCCHALAGDKELAIKALQRVLEMGFPDLGRPARDPKLRSLRDDVRFKKMLWLEDLSKMSREEGWRYDLSVLGSEVHRKGFLVHRPITPQQFDAKLRELREAIRKLTDAQAVLAVVKLMTFLGDGHSTVLPNRQTPAYRTAVPIQFYWFAEGLFVISADPKYKDLLGAEVLQLDGRPTADVLKAMTPYVSRDRGNPMWPKQLTPYMLRYLTLLHAAGQIKSPRRVTLTVRGPGGAKRDVTVAADATQPDIWNQLPNPPSWVNFASTLGKPPYYLRSMDKNYWFEYLTDRKTVYFQFNRVLDGAMESLAQFTERLIQFIDEKDVERLIIDMRWNNGGNTALSHPLVLALIGNRKINQRGKLFVIIGRRTYSAAQNTVTYIERYTNATFVGEPTGSSPNFVGEEFFVTLPYSKIVANVSHLFWQSSVPQDQRIWLAPHIYTPPTFADFRARRDPALEAILKYGARSGR